MVLRHTCSGIPGTPYAVLRWGMVLPDLARGCYDDRLARPGPSAMLLRVSCYQRNCAPTRTVLPIPYAWAAFPSYSTKATLTGTSGSLLWPAVTITRLEVTAQQSRASRTLGSQATAASDPRRNQWSFARPWYRSATTSLSG
eukprot:1804805-Rhodomonas_salina.1